MVTARFFGGFCATNSVICRGCGFVWYGVRVLYGILYSVEEVLSPFSGSCVFGGPVSGSVFLLLSSFSFSFFFPLSALGAGSGFPAFVCVCLFAGQRPREGRCGLHHDMFRFFLFCSLCPGRLPSTLYLSFFLSLSLSFFLLSLACNSVRDGRVTSGKCWPMGIDYCYC